MKKLDKYIERNDLNGATHIEVKVYYTKGGANYSTGGNLPRGYYISVRSVTKRDGMVSYALFSGCKRLLFETARYTDKQFAKAADMAKEFEEELIAAVVAENKAA